MVTSIVIRITNDMAISCRSSYIHIGTLSKQIMQIEGGEEFQNIAGNLRIKGSKQTLYSFTQKIKTIPTLLRQ